ncbi:tRNA (cytidine(34)-2'-O)-methyltransferase [Calidithermus roseus]|uniref:Putative tRNA (cytidine(34)-2'-O)-methyltransferase n=1 Tax=Calidithermus roseus TaxID=1644118 RepID=A0A399EFG2_9DEIN|nr:tRNA (cytidine(34)-2'-O)-methyltransferase [Calidithermus roseus]RIH82945.1 tRNA (cytidine(34)-2'-O)-methyltransferase [Calidithermus roseus]
MLRVVLYQPDIPQNTGNIARTCASAGAELHLIRPFGFRWFEGGMARSGDPRLKRAGLDYWPHVRYVLHDSWAKFVEQLEAGARVWAFSSKAQQPYTDVRYRPGDYLLFGPETRGLPEEVLRQFPGVSIPMPGPVRSLNVSVAVGIALFEALRQLRSDGV